MTFACHAADLCDTTNDANIFVEHYTILFNEKNDRQMNLFAHINTLLALIIVVIIGTARGLWAKGNHKLQKPRAEKSGVFTTKLSSV